LAALRQSRYSGAICTGDSFSENLPNL